MVRAEVRARVLPLLGTGRTRTQPIFADDVVNAIVAALGRAGLCDIALDLAGPESLSQREFIYRAARLYGRRPILVKTCDGIGCKIIKKGVVTSKCKLALDSSS